MKYVTFVLCVRLSAGCKTTALWDCLLGDILLHTDSKRRSDCFTLGRNISRHFNFFPNFKVSEDLNLEKCILAILTGHKTYFAISSKILWWKNKWGFISSLYFLLSLFVHYFRFFLFLIKIPFTCKKYISFLLPFSSPAFNTYSHKLSWKKTIFKTHS